MLLPAAPGPEANRSDALRGVYFEVDLRVSVPVNPSIEKSTKFNPAWMLKLKLVERGNRRPSAGAGRTYVFIVSVHYLTLGT